MAKYFKVVSFAEGNVMDFLKICSAFDLKGEVKEWGQIIQGNINSTYVVYTSAPDKERKYIIQKINSYVFKKPVEVMENIVSVAEYIRAKIRMRQYTAKRNVLHYISSKDMEAIVRDEEGEYWRCYRFIDDSISFDNPDDLFIIEQAGMAFGSFQNDLSDFDPSSLNTTIPDFHNTAKRYEVLKEVAKKDEYNRLESVREEYEYLLSMEKVATRLCKMAECNYLPMRVTHNDTKCNNVLFDKETKEALAVIDLDTVMPGIMANDFGDGARSIASRTSEDTKNLSLVGIDLNKFEAFTKGFLSQVSASITEAELDTLAISVYALTIELAVRFMSDYLSGDVYFRVAYSEHNLDRTRCQVALAKDIYSKQPQMEKIIKDNYKQ